MKDQSIQNTNFSYFIREVKLADHCLNLEGAQCRLSYISNSVSFAVETFALLFQKAAYIVNLRGNYILAMNFDFNA